MKSLLNNSFYSLILILSILGCRKDSPIPQVNILNEQEPADTLCDSCQTCKDFPPSGELDYLFYNSGVQYTSPCFNPLNPDEFICIKNGTLIKYEISSQTETVLCNSLSIVTPPQWGENGWVVFSDASYKVFKINQNSAGLQQITYGVKDLYPYFNNDNNLIYYFRNKNYSNFELQQNPNLYSEYKMIGIDINGNVLDSITAQNVIPNNYYQTWSTVVDIFNNKVYFYAEINNIYSLYQLDLSTQNINFITDLDEKYTLVSLEFYNNKIYFTSYYDDLKVVDINTGEISVFIEGCQTKFYHWLSMSPFGDKILAEKIINKPIVYDNGEVAIEGKHQIWMIDVQTKEETLILGE